MRGARVFGLVLGLVLTAAACGEEDFSKGMLDRARVIASLADVDRDRYPDADEVLVASRQRVRYQADGTYVQWDEAYVKLLTEKGRREHSTLSSVFTIPYQRGPQDCKVSLVEIIRPGGEVVAIDVAANSKLMINPRSMGANIYNPNDKVIRVNVPGLQVGDTLHYVMFDRIVQPRIKQTFCDWMSFEGPHPIVHAAVEIRGPKDRPLRAIAVKDRAGQTLTAHDPVEQDGEIVYRWEARDVPRMFPEPDMPPVYMVTQRVLVSTAPDWQTISRWYWELSKPHLTPSEAMEAKVDEIVNGLDDRQKKIEAVFRWVSQEIRYLGITAEAEAPGYEPHDVADTFGQKHGVCRDKAALLVAMLRLAGFDAYPVLIHQGPKKDPEVPQPYFNHAITAVRNPNGSYVLMDATDESTRQLLPAYLNNKSYLVATPDGDSLRTSPIDPAADNMMQVGVTGRIDAAGTLTAEAVLRFAGINDNIYRGYFARSKPEVRRRYFEGVIKRAAPGARLTSIDIQPANMMDTSVPLSVRLTFEAPDVTVRGGRHVMLPVPSLGSSVGMVNFIIGKTGLKERQYPMLTEIACGVHEEIAIEVAPELGAPAAIPASEPYEDDAMSWSLGVSYDQGTLKATGDFRLKVVEFSPEQYLALKETLKRIELDLDRMPIFVTKTDRPVAEAPSSPASQPADQAGGGDVLVIDSRLEIDLDDARNWTETRTARLRVLTYRGKKQFSEIKVPYNPSWEQIDLAYARVHAADGTVRPISDKEINRMDAPWAGTAPRYPADKVFVASLPGVEVGSVIEYCLKRTAKGHPFFAANRSFQGFNPIGRESLTVRAPATLKLTAALLHDPEGTVSASRNEEEGRTILEWRVQEVPALKREDALPPDWAYTPTVFLSAGDWMSWAATVHQRLAAAAADQKLAAAKARGLTDQLADPHRKIEAIRDFVAVNIRAAGPSLPGMPLSYVTPADKTLADGYGNTTDRAVLLFAMLAAAGFEPQYVLASDAPRVDRLRDMLLARPDADRFARVLVRVRLDADDEPRIVYLNDTDQYAALGATPHDGRAGLVLPQGAVETIAAAPARSDARDVSLRLEITADGDATVTRTRRLHGTTFGTVHRQYEEMTPELRRRHHEELIATIAQNAEAQGDLETDFSTYPGVEAFSVTVEDFAIRDGDYLYFQLPESLRGVLWLRSHTRDNPLYLPAPTRATVVNEVIIPEGFEPVIVPQGIDWHGPEGSVRSTSERSSRRLRICGTAALAPSLVSPARYPELFDLYRRLSHPDARMVLLRRK